MSQELWVRISSIITKNVIYAHRPPSKSTYAFHFIPSITFDIHLEQICHRESTNSLFRVALPAKHHSHQHRYMDGWIPFVCERLRLRRVERTMVEVQRLLSNNFMYPQSIWNSICCQIKTINPTQCFSIL